MTILINAVIIMLSVLVIVQSIKINMLSKHNRVLRAGYDTAMALCERTISGWGAGINEHKEKFNALLEVNTMLQRHCEELEKKVTQ